MKIIFLKLKQTKTIKNIQIQLKIKKLYSFFLIIVFFVDWNWSLPVAWLKSFP